MTMTNQPQEATFGVVQMVHLTIQNSNLFKDALAWKQIFNRRGKTMS